MQSLQQVNFLTQQYKTGPAQNPSNKTDTYLKYLNEELARVIGEFEKNLRDANSKHDEWVSGTTSA